jgi:hypothetical protein
MARRKTKPAVTAQEVKEAFDDLRKKERRFNHLAYGKRQYSELLIDAAARNVDVAFNLVHSLLLRANGAKHHQACAAVFPDGSHLVVVSVRAGPVREKLVKLELIPPHKVTRLS